MCTQQLEERIKITTRRKQLIDKATREIRPHSPASCNIQTSASATFTPVTKRRKTSDRSWSNTTRRNFLVVSCLQCEYFLSLSLETTSPLMPMLLDDASLTFLNTDFVIDYQIRHLLPFAYSVSISKLDKKKLNNRRGT